MHLDLDLHLGDPFQALATKEKYHPPYDICNFINYLKKKENILKKR